MKDLKRLSAAGIVMVVVAALLLVAPGGGSSGPEERYRFVDMLSMGDSVALDPLADNIRIIIAPDESFWQRTSKQRGLFERGVVAGVYDDYVSIRITDELAVDPVTPQGKTRLIHVPVHAIARITTFTDARY